MPDETMKTEPDTLAAEKAAEDAARDGDADHLTDEELSHEVDQLPGEADEPHDV